MKIKIVKMIVSIYGPMKPGETITVSDHIGRNWVKNGIAESLEPVEEEEAAPEPLEEEEAMAEPVEEVDSAPEPDPESKPVLRRRRKPRTPR